MASVIKYTVDSPKPFLTMTNMRSERLKWFLGPNKHFKSNLNQCLLDYFIKQEQPQADSDLISETTTWSLTALLNLSIWASSHHYVIYAGW
eukprot:TRINITY_DN35185_c0_g1_i1.p1 TRINITY_DN35185_c0_g1~~TRINITY_DN35185_c0_g1_i1.p1  ORF type:complete len:101 (+),score=14.33 TRINITY_DN35185_c0_g1_i1:32-304(+)